MIREEIFRFVAGNASTWFRRITITREDTERVCPSVVFADRPLCRPVAPEWPAAVRLSGDRDPSGDQTQYERSGNAAERSAT